MISALNRRQFGMHLRDGAKGLACLKAHGLEAGQHETAEVKVTPRWDMAALPPVIRRSSMVAVTPSPTLRTL